MWLLDARALIHENTAQLVDRQEVDNPDYVILSHTWGKEEVTFSDIVLGPYHEVTNLNTQQRAEKGYKTKADTNSHRRFGWKGLLNDPDFIALFADVIPVNKPEGPHHKKGWSKVWNACLKACRDDYDYIWIDTCCIDKSSSTELSEAINSMFDWYANSSICYVYLEDCTRCPDQARNGKPSFCTIDIQPHISAVEMKTVTRIDHCTTQQIRRCRWLKRGWTLQEMIAPSSLAIFDTQWTMIGSTVAADNNIMEILSDAAKIDRKVLPAHVTEYTSNTLVFRHYSHKSRVLSRVREASVATRMSWASQRETTRPEDEAYSLLGIFDVNMPIMYGEGIKAFQRLSEEIVKQEDDDSVFAWEASDAHDTLDQMLFPNSLIFASSPKSYSWVRSLFPKKMSIQAAGLQADQRITHELSSRTLLLSTSVLALDHTDAMLDPPENLHECESGYNQSKLRSIHAFFRCQIAERSGHHRNTRDERHVLRYEIALRMRPRMYGHKQMRFEVFAGPVCQLEVFDDTRQALGLGPRVGRIALHKPYASADLPMNYRSLVIQRIPESGAIFKSILQW